MEVGGFVCDVEGCGKRFSKKCRLVNHQNGHLNTKPFKCEMEGCSASYSWPQHLNRHKIRIHGKERAVKCTLDGCVASFDDNFALTQHIRRYHKKHTVDYWCKVCDQQFKTEWKLREHEGSHTNKEPFRCDKCDSAFFAYQDLNRHLRTSHKSVSDTTAKFPCTECSKKLATQDLLDKHLQIHKEGHACDVCGKVFKHGPNLRKHVAAVHNENPVKFQCPIEGCEREYIHEKNMRSHVKLFHANMRFECELCSQVLSTKQKLMQHQRVHDNQHKPKKPKKSKYVKRREATIRAQLTRNEPAVALPPKRKPVLQNTHSDYVLKANQCQLL